MLLRLFTLVAFLRDVEKLTVIYSTYLLWHSLAHIDAYGPKSAHARTRADIAKPLDEKPASLAESTTDGTTLTQPGQTHARPDGFHDRNEAANQQYSVV